jgi:DNA-binding transcriptional regulator YiaG
LDKTQIQELLDRLGLSPIQFASAIGCTEASVKAWLRGDYEPGRLANHNISEYLKREGKVVKA